jgi:hypothetical protein
MLMCRDHWWPVPSDVQREVNATWKAWRRNPAHFDAFQAHDNAVKAAVAAVLASRARIAQARQEAFNES